MQIQLENRDVPPRSAWTLEQQGVHPLLARLFASRGLSDVREADTDLKNLLPPGGEQGLKGLPQALDLLCRARQAGTRICVVADYDCDGATACATALRGLALLGFADVQYIVPDRVRDGYGLTPVLAERAHALGAGILMTVDNGIASVEGVAAALALGMEVLVTDHHLPGAVAVAAQAVLNPNQAGCPFPSKSLAGVGVVFYLLMALRTRLREEGAFGDKPQPRLDILLPLVALGTVADVVPLDQNNRCLVAQGLRRIRALAMPVGLRALFDCAKRNPQTATSHDLGFAIGPRINAAGRLADMRMGIACLLTDDAGQAAELAQQLDAINRARRDIEGGMREQALQLAQNLFPQGEEPLAALSLFDPDFHEGVVGIVASRIKEHWNRPTFVFAPSQAEGQEHILKGSGRSIAGFHLRDALDLLSKQHPGVLLRFGGHAMAAGCTIEETDFEAFEAALARIAKDLIDPATMQRRLHTDGPLEAQFLRPDVVAMLDEQVWGQGFAAPLFCDAFTVLSQRLVGADKHLALKLQSAHSREILDAIWFGRTDTLPTQCRLAYRLMADEWQGVRKVKLGVEAMG